MAAKLLMGAGLTRPDAPVPAAVREGGHFLSDHPPSGRYEAEAGRDVHGFSGYRWRNRSAMLHPRRISPAARSCKALPVGRAAGGSMPIPVRAARSDPHAV